MSSSFPTPSTQTKYPWRATVRTVFQVAVGLAASWAVLVHLLGLNSQWQWVAVGGAVAAAITRAMAQPQVEFFLQTYFPWLAATPKNPVTPLKPVAK